MNLYLLPNKTTGFKIGKANDVLKRFFQLRGAEVFIPDDCLYLQLNSEIDAVVLERFMHRRFWRWRLPVDPNNRFHGDTENFNSLVFVTAIGFLNQSRDRLKRLSVDDWINEGRALDYLSKRGIALASGRRIPFLAILFPTRNNPYRNSRTAT